MTARDQGGLWGFCQECERWRYSEAWYPPEGDDPRCPACGLLPALIERREGNRFHIDLFMEVATGPVGRRDPLWYERDREAAGRQWD